MEKIEISPDAAFVVGDVIEMHFNTFGPTSWTILQATQYVIIEMALKRQFPELEVISSKNVESGFVITFRVTAVPAPTTDDPQQAGVLTAAIVAAAVIGGGIFVWLSLDKVYQIVDSPAGQVALVGAGAMGIGVLVIVLLLAFGLLKGRG